MLATVSLMPLQASYSRDMSGIEILKVPSEPVSDGTWGRGKETELEQKACVCYGLLKLNSDFYQTHVWREVQV